MMQKKKPLLAHEDVKDDKNEAEEDEEEMLKRAIAMSLEEQ